MGVRGKSDPHDGLEGRFVCSVLFFGAGTLSQTVRLRDGTLCFFVRACLR